MPPAASISSIAPAIVSVVPRRSRDRAERLRERRHDDHVLRTDERRQLSRGLADEVDPPPHAGAGVDEQGVRRRNHVRLGDVEHLRHAVLEHVKLLRREAVDGAVTISGSVITGTKIDVTAENLFPA